MIRAWLLRFLNGDESLAEAYVIVQRGVPLTICVSAEAVQREIAYRDRAGLHIHRVPVVR